MCEVPKISLSIVPGIPITGKLYSLLKTTPPVKDPSPPITTKPSMLLSFNCLNAFFLPSGVLNSSDLADFSMVPPLLMILLIFLAVSVVKSPSIIP